MKILLFALFFFSTFSQSDSTMRTFNLSNISMEVFFIAYFGCNGIATDIQGDIQTFVCEKNQIGPGKASSFTWNSLNAGRVMKVFSEDKKYLVNTDSMDDEQVIVTGDAPNLYVSNSDDGNEYIHTNYQWPEKKLFLNEEGDVEGGSGDGYIDRDLTDDERRALEEGEINDDMYIPDDEEYE